MSSTSEINTSEINLYPNPCFDSIKINESNSNYEIISISGQIVKSGFTRNGLIDTSSLNSGLFILRIDNAKSSKFLKL